MNSTALVFLVLGIALLVFGAVFAFLGMSNERAYWLQRDPKGDPTHEATPFGTILRNPFRISAAETRASLRVAAIGVVMWWFALAAFVITIVVSATS